jgi:hypothetical protein
MQRDMGRLENRANLHRELLAAIGALTKANTGFAQIIMLTAYRTAMRANRTIRPQNAFEMSESGAFIMKVRSGHCGNSGHVIDSYCGIELSTFRVVCQLRNCLSNQATTLESHMIHKIQYLSGRTLSLRRIPRSNRASRTRRRARVAAARFLSAPRSRPRYFPPWGFRAPRYRSKNDGRAALAKV